MHVCGEETASRPECSFIRISSPVALRAAPTTTFISLGRTLSSMRLGLNWLLNNLLAHVRVQTRGGGAGVSFACSEERCAEIVDMLIVIGL